MSAKTAMTAKKEKKEKTAKMEMVWEQIRPLMVLKREIERERELDEWWERQAMEKQLGKSLEHW
jgi:hypothetical protein